MTVLRRVLGVLLALSLAGAAAAAPPTEQEIHYFRIGTGTSSGNYFLIGGLIANAITSPPGARPCRAGDGCGVPGLIALAQATSGGIENLELLRAGSIEAAMVQANLAHGAYRGEGVYQGRPPFTDLRLIATLYTETVQIVVRADSPITRAADLQGKKISVGEKGSAIAIDARLVLDALGLPEKRYTPVYLRPGASVDHLVEGRIDALFIVGGAPFAAIADAATRVAVRLIAITPPEAAALRRSQPFFADATIPADVYPGVPEISTVGVGAVLAVRVGLDDAVVEGVTRALWRPATRTALEEGFPKGVFLPLALARDGDAVPLHPGAARFYNDPAPAQ